MTKESIDLVVVCVRFTLVFSSLEFLFVFLPIFLIIYFAVPHKANNACIFAGSLIFYGYGVANNPGYILLIIISVAVSWLCGMAMDKFERFKNPILVFGLVYNFFWLFFFKYTAFAAGAINSLLSFLPHIEVSLPLPALVLPIGISFYTFQTASYLIDVYRKKFSAERSFINLGTYICMFPQLIAGPIVTYDQIKRALKRKAITRNHFNNGLKTFTLGLGYKVLLANFIGGLWSQICTIGFANISTPLAWMGIIAYTLQIYFDFYGYSLMASGLGEIIGFHIPKNFFYPYLSVSMTEFWRRWHITLGAWFREYLYIPLGGSHGGKLITMRNLLIVWLATGLWHGADWNFLLWGLFLFALIALEKLWFKKFFDSHRIIGHIYMILAILISWTLFAISDFSQLGVFIGRLFPIFSSPSGVMPADYLKYLGRYGIAMLIGLVFCTGLPHNLYNKIKEKPLGAVVLLVIFWASVRLIYIGMDNPFLYFRF